MNKEAKFGVWKYFMSEDDRAKWKCSECGKVCKRNPHDKLYCSNCGAKMKMEA